MDGEFYDFLYNSGANQKSLVWSICFTEPKFLGKNMELGGTEVEMTLKMSDAQTALVYYSALLEMKGKAFPVGEGNALILEQIKMVREEKITQPFAMFKVLSPICLKEREEKEDELVGIADDKVCVLDISDIIRVFVEDRKVFVVTTKGKFVVRKKLYEMNNLLTKDFVKISQSEIANIKFIKNLDLSIRGTIVIVYKNSDISYVSRRLLKDFKTKLGL